jgi:hypothetical protein
MKWTPLILLLLATPADAACHIYRTWHYNYPQRCGYVHENKPHQAENKGHQTSSASVVAQALKLPPVDMPFDNRTNWQIREEAEHDAAIVYGHDELNRLMRELALSQQKRDVPR